MRTRIFYGWFVVLSAHLLFALIFGAAYSYGVFFSHIQKQFGIGLFFVASIFSLIVLRLGIIGPGFGYAHIDRWQGPAR